PHQFARVKLADFSSARDSSGNLPRSHFRATALFARIDRVVRLAAALGGRARAAGMHDPAPKGVEATWVRSGAMGYSRWSCRWDAAAEPATRKAMTTAAEAPAQRARFHRAATAQPRVRRAPRAEGQREYLRSTST